MNTDFLSSTILAILFAPILLLSIHVAGAQVMSSGNFQIKSDSVNISGGLSASANYSLESTTGEVATGLSGSANYLLRSGYQQMHEIYLAMTVAPNVVMDTAIGGITGGVSNGSTNVTITTDSLSGYQLTIQTSSSPAMQRGLYSIADYSSGPTPDFVFTTASTESHFGYTPEGLDVVQRFLDDSITCGVGSGNTPSACWDGLSTLAVPIASASTSNHPSGTNTSILFRVGIGGGVIQPEGTYTATITLTALPI